MDFVHSPLAGEDHISYDAGSLQCCRKSAIATGTRRGGGGAGRRIAARSLASLQTERAQTGRLAPAFPQDGRSPICSLSLM